MGLSRLIVSMGFILIFVIAIFAYMTGFASDNSSAVDIGDDAELSGLKTDTETRLSEFRTNVDSSGQALANSTVGTEDDAAKVGGIAKTSPIKAYDGVKDVLRVGYKKVFGNDDTFGIVINSLLAFIGIIVTLYIIKTIRSGDPD